MMGDLIFGQPVHPLWIVGWASPLVFCFYSRQRPLGVPNLPGSRMRPGDPLVQQCAGGGASVLSDTRSYAAGQQDGFMRVIEVRHLIAQRRHEVGRSRLVAGGVCGVHAKG
jgi:hypothetical protein